MTPPPAAYDLTELQRDANKKYAYSAKETLNLMQALYEQHKLLTYPRTDSRYISDDVVPTLPDRLRAVMTGDYKPFAQELMRRRPLSTRYLVNNARSRIITPSSPRRRPRICGSFPGRSGIFMTSSCAASLRC